MRPIARAMVATVLLGGTLIMLPGCSSTPIPLPYTQAELRAQCESRGGRWHDGDPLRSFCEYDSRE
jgi:hypothetical protein